MVVGGECIPGRGLRNPTRCLFEPCARTRPAPWTVTTTLGTPWSDRYAPISPAHVGECDHARAASIALRERIVTPDSLELREHLGVAVARGVRRELEREARGEAV